MNARTPTELMRLYWAECRRRNENPRPVHALVAGKGSSQPSGYVMAWGVNLRYVENRRDALPDGSTYEIQLMQPEPVGP